ncbi:MAG: hypothetical protein GX442_05965 [Candidatus Riflebacteria bacterium]|nr:hypothetical protein [Candidatus Riflebacteria bacterium]
MIPSATSGSSRPRPHPFPGPASTVVWVAMAAWLLIGTGASAAPLAVEEDEPRFSSSVELLLEYLLTNTGKGPREPLRALWVEMLCQLPFQEFLAGRGIHDPLGLAPDHRRTLVQEFLERQFRAFDDPVRLRPRQSASLWRSLWVRHGGGLALDGDGYAALARLSAANRQRLEQRLPPMTDAVPADVQKWLDRLSLVFVHNTHVVRDVPDLPLVSSRIIREVTGLGGLNTYAFNRFLLRSDDNLFFFVGLQVDGSLGSHRESLYGKYKFSPAPDFARDRGWVSAYVMYPYDLARFGDSLDPALSAAFLADFQREFPRELAGIASAGWEAITARLGPSKRQESRWLRVLQRRLPDWLRVRGALASLDFTVSDFEALSREALRRHLTVLWRTDRENWASLEARLGRGEAGNLLYDALREVFGLDLYFEFKIPVAIPAAAIQAVR